jgi:two-component system cell cycle response regulator
VKNRPSSPHGHRAPSHPPRQRSDSGTLKAARAEIVAEAVTGTRSRPLPQRAPSIARMMPTPREFIVPPATLADRWTITVLSGMDAGRTFSLGPTTVIGRDLTADVVIDDEAVSRFHARISRLPDGSFLLEDLDSTNGTFVDAEPVTRWPLASGARLHLGPHVALRFATTDEAEDTLQRRLYEASTRDALTGALNRAALMERLAAEVAFTRRSGASVWLLMLDVDRFKAVNDTHGHLVGDQLLCAIARRAARVVRVEDVFARYGGDEFVVLSRAGDIEQARVLADRLRQSLKGVGLRLGDELVSTFVSIGGGSLAECPNGAGEDLVALADRRLYAAKAAGRDRICLEG